MAEKISNYTDGEGNKGFHFHCPGCGHAHGVYVEGVNVPIWSYNGNLNSPTFEPSILCTYEYGEQKEKRICHSFVRNGQIQYLDDCTHHLKGQIVDLPDF